MTHVSGTPLENIRLESLRVGRIFVDRLVDTDVFATRALHYRLLFIRS
jgi:hypothetical protein